MTSRKFNVIGALAFASLAGCAPMHTRSDRDYDERYGRGEAVYDQGRDYRQDQGYDDGYDNDRREAACDTCGVVRGISRVTIERGNNTGSIILGAVVGGALGNTVGSGDGRRAATVAGAVAGGAVANNLTRDDARRSAYRIDVQMDNGGMYSYQQYDHEDLRQGSLVEVRNGHVYPLR